MKYERRNTNVRHKTLADARQSTVAGGFTLIELITVIIIIGIMLGVALPKYMKMAEKTKASNAKRVLDIIRKAEEAYYAENSVYISFSDTDITTCSLADELPVQKIQNDSDWDYGVPTINSIAFTATASRINGPFGTAGGLIVINSDGNFNYCNTNTICTSDNSDARKYWK